MRLVKSTDRRTKIRGVFWKEVIKKDSSPHLHTFCSHILWYRAVCKTKNEREHNSNRQKKLNFLIKKEEKYQRKFYLKKIK